jgi:hypothetical protein
MPIARIELGSAWRVDCARDASIRAAFRARGSRIAPLQSVGSARSSAIAVIPQRFDRDPGAGRCGWSLEPDAAASCWREVLCCRLIQCALARRCPRAIRVAIDEASVYSAIAIQVPSLRRGGSK